MEEEKYYYAEPANLEWYNYEDYYDEDQAKEDKLWAGGNDYKDSGQDYYNDINRLFEYLQWDVSQELSSTENTDKDAQVEIVSIAKSYVRNFDKEIQLTDKELNYLIHLAYKYDGCDKDDKIDIIAEALTLFYKEQFISGVFRGNSQGDYMYYICPKSLEPSLDYIEAVLMATGTEFTIAADKCTEEEFKNGDADTYNAYTAEWNGTKIKEWIADLQHCNPDEVKLLEYKY